MSSLRNQRGFSLVELILVMAISSSLAVIAFAGQRTLRSQAQFDAAVTRTVATIADARSEAVAGVNVTGGGNGTSGCGGGPAGQYVFAGTVWTADSSLGTDILKLEYYKALPAAGATGACAYDTRVLGLPTPLQVTLPSTSGARKGGRVIFVRTATGSVQACPVSNLTTDVRPSFTAGGCAAGTMTLTFTDTDGHSSQVTIDPNGLAKRIN